MRFGRALLVLVAPAFASVAGCELIAGVRDITESEGGAGSDGPGSNFDALGGPDTPGSTGGDATQSDGPGSGDAPAGTDGTVSDVASGSDVAPGVDAQMDGGSKQDAAADAPNTDAAGSTYVLIDDMEGNTGEISAPSGGNGYWFTYGDGTAGGVESPAAAATFTDSMIVSPRTVVTPFVTYTGTPSNWAAQVSGSGFNSFAGMGFDFKSATGTAGAYNASSYSGFVFWGMSGSGSSASVTFSVPDGNTLLVGGVCTTCDAYFSKTITLTSSWQQFTIYYTDLSQPSFGVPQETALDAASVYKVLFQVSTKAPAGEAFDIWIDDIYFIKP